MTRDSRTNGSACRGSRCLPAWTLGTCGLNFEAIHPLHHAGVQARAVTADEGAQPSFSAPTGARKRGCYESKGLLGLAHLYRAVDPAELTRVKRGLGWIAGVQAAWQGTGILGECWYVRDGRVISIVSQPHVWEQVLFYLAALAVSRLAMGGLARLVAVYRAAQQHESPTGEADPHRRSTDRSDEDDSDPATLAA